MNDDVKMWNSFQKVATRWPDDVGVKLTLELQRWHVQQRRWLAEEEAAKRRLEV